MRIKKLKQICRKAASQSGGFEAASAQDYYPYGEYIPSPLLNGSSQDKYKFTEKEPATIKAGKRDKETVYDYFGARYYNSRLSLWQSVDPLADKYPGWNPYNYTVGNPLRLVDPDGMVVELIGDDIIAAHNELYKNNEEYRKRYDLMHASSNTYRVMKGDLGKNNDGGRTVYKGNEIYDVVIGSGLSQSIESRMTHEFEHGRQIEEGELAFASFDNGKTWNPIFYDLNDEVKAWDIGLLAASKSDFWSNGTKSSLSQYSEKQQNEKALFLKNSIGGGYNRLGVNSLNIDLKYIRNLVENGILVKYNTGEK